MLKIPKFVEELLLNGELQSSKQPLEGFEGYTFRLFVRNGTEAHFPRSLEQTKALAEKIQIWAIQNGSYSVVRGDDWLWWNPYGRYWERLDYVFIGITEPVSLYLEEVIKKVAEALEEEQGINALPEVLTRPIKERSRIDLLNKAQERFEPIEDLLVGYYRAYHDRYQWSCSWFDVHQELKIPDVKSEIEWICKEIVFKMFPGGLPTMKSYCLEVNAEYIGEDTYNMYFNGKLCDYWIRFLLRQGDYNIYLKCYRRAENAAPVEPAKKAIESGADESCTQQSRGEGG